MCNAMIIDSADNVAVAIEPIAKGDSVEYVRGTETIFKMSFCPARISMPGVKSAVAVPGIY